MFFSFKKMSIAETSVSCSPQCAETDYNKNTGDTNPETVQNTISNNSQVEQASQSDSDPLKHLLTRNFCYVCDATLLYESQRLSHYQGKKHAQKVKNFLQKEEAEKQKQSKQTKVTLKGLSSDPEKFCDLCNMVFSSATVARSHYLGKVHAKNVRKANAAPQKHSAPPQALTRTVVVPVQTKPAMVAAQKKQADVPVQKNITDPVQKFKEAVQKKQAEVPVQKNITDPVQKFKEAVQKKQAEVPVHMSQAPLLGFTSLFARPAVNTEQEKQAEVPVQKTTADPVQKLKESVEKKQADVPVPTSTMLFSRPAVNTEQKKTADVPVPTSQASTALLAQPAVNAEQKKQTGVPVPTSQSPFLGFSTLFGRPAVNAELNKQEDVPVPASQTLLLGSTTLFARPEGNAEQKKTATALVQKKLADPVQKFKQAVEKAFGLQQSDSSSSSNQEVSDDPNKYCKLCNASFNKPMVAQQHYGGRKHQRNQARQQMMDQLADQSEHASSLTCPICCLTFSSIEMYQAHMQGNKHHVKEKKVMDLCHSQKKVYDTYQDELADYIQVQKARGLEPKTNSATVGQTSKSLPEISDEEEEEEEMLHPPDFPQPHWHPQFQSQLDHFGYRMRGPVPNYPPEYMSNPLHQFVPGRTLKRRRGPDSSSSYSDSSSSSSYTSSSSDSSSSYESRQKRRQKRKVMMQKRKMNYQEDGAYVDKRAREEERGDRKTRERKRRKKERSSSEDEQGSRRRRLSKKRRRQEEAKYSKRRKEEELMEIRADVVQNDEMQIKEAQVNINENLTDMPSKESKQKHKKDKKKTKEKNPEDTRTEEEKLWDETILGVF